MNEIFEKIYNDNNTDLNESSALFEKVYTEAEMLNEMNPKLRALLAAGLIGTASLGAASCSMPTDDPTIYEQPAPETTNPDNPNPNPDDPGDNNGGEEENGGDEELTEEQKWAQTLFGQLGVTREEAEIIVSEDTIKQGPISTGINPDNGKDYFEAIATKAQVFVYTANQFVSYQKSSPSVSVIYKNSAVKVIYVIPADMEDAFADAIAAYNNAQ